MRETPTLTPPVEQMSAHLVSKGWSEAISIQGKLTEVYLRRTILGVFC